MNLKSIYRYGNHEERDLLMQVPFILRQHETDVHPAFPAFIRTISG
ncbi:hypothetical protein CBFG_01377 [Clostridiales bacterium 1_7_47FAA]|nr:hypothetical protein CBFG_01377 [Clostridiales bacterium 1_7_47FAA]